MPVVRFGGTEEEKVKAVSPKVELLDAMKTNRAIADLVVSKLNQRFESDLGPKLGESQAIHLSISWG